MKSSKTGAWEGLAVAASTKALHSLGFDTYLYRSIRKYSMSEFSDFVALSTYSVRLSTGQSSDSVHGFGVLAVVVKAAALRGSSPRIFSDHEPPWTLESRSSRLELSVPDQCFLLVVVVRPPGSDEIVPGYLYVL